MLIDQYFDESVAETYDADVDSFNPKTVEPAVDFLAELAGCGRALEFGIGTGRIALPLPEKGIEVQGRWGGWQNEPFTNTSRYHVSVWEKPRKAAESQAS